MGTLKRKNADGNWEYIQVSGLDVAQLQTDVDNVQTSLSTKANQSDLDTTNASLADKASQASVSLKADKTYVDSQVQAMNAQVQGFYATASALTTAFPTGNTNNYVVTADNYIYRWNGSVWASTGFLFNNALITDKAIKMNHLDTSLRNMAIFKKVDVTLQTGFYTVSNNTFNANSGYKAFVQTCTPGEVYSVDGYVVGSTVALVVFYKSDGTVLSYLEKVANQKYTQYEFTVPTNAASFSVTSRLPTLPALRKLTIVDKENFMIFKEVTGLTVQEGFYNTYSAGFTANTGYHTITQNCIPGEIYRASTYVVGSAAAVVIFYDGNGTQLSYLGVATNQLFTDYEFTVPQDASTFVITSRLPTEPVLKKKQVFTYSDFTGYVDKQIPTAPFAKYPIAAQLLGSIFEVMFHYTDALDMIVTFENCGVSGLKQMKNFYTVPRDSNFGDFTKTRTDFKISYSDWVGPYKVVAKNNIDGDNPTDTSFTGGWHGYSGGATGGATGTRVSAHLYVDNKEVTSSNPIMLGQSVKIIIVNQVNGSNTKKSDGTGRNILEEKVTFIIDGTGKMEVSNQITALEDLTINEYYGLQIESGTTWQENVIFWNDITDKMDYSVNVYKGLVGTEPNCNKFTAIGGTGINRVTAFINNEGLGRRNYVTNGQGTAWLAASPTNKAYFNLVKGKPLDLASGQKTFWKGGYIFTSGDALL